jgi:predicted transcriptional regulator
MADSGLNEKEKRILGLIQQGFIYMSELVDSSEIPGREASDIIEKLDETRYIERRGLTRSNFWAFLLTAKGESVLPPLSEKNKALKPLGIVDFDLETLKTVQKTPDKRASDLVRSTITDKEKQMLVATSIVKLLRLKYLSERGFMKRIINITDAGLSIIKQYG